MKLSDHFDKLLVLLLAFAILGVLLFIHAYWQTSPVVAWLEKSFDIVTGTFLGLVTGQVIRKTEEPKS